MIGKNLEPLYDYLELELKGLKLNLIDMVSEYTKTIKDYSPYLALYEAELEALVGLSKAGQHKGLEAIAKSVISLNNSCYNRG